MESEMSSWQSDDLAEREGDKLTVPCVRCGQDAYDSDTCADCDRELEGYRLAEREGEQLESAMREHEWRKGRPDALLAEREGDQDEIMRDAHSKPLICGEYGSVVERKDTNGR